MATQSRRPTSAPPPQPSQTAEAAAGLPPTDPPTPGAGSWGSNLALSAISAAVFLAVAEIVLRLTGFSFVLYPQDIEFGRPDPVMLEKAFRPDDDLFWVTPDYSQKLAALERSRPPLLLLGDSCTHLGHWDDALGERVHARFGRQLEWGNLAVAGWSSHQGRVQMERDVRGLEPEVITLYFGWNDHWIGFGVDDRTVARVKRIFTSRASRLRLVQLVTKAVLAWKAHRSPYPNRVSLPHFEENLRSMAELARAEGAVPVFLTAASSHEPGKEPEELEQRWLRDASELVPLHRSYVEVVRRVAADTASPLCDLAFEIDGLPPEERDRLFLADGIHFTPEGDRYLAASIFACLEEAGLWPRILEGAEKGRASAESS